MSLPRHRQWHDNFWQCCYYVVSRRPGFGTYGDVFLCTVFCAQCIQRQFAVDVSAVPTGFFPKSANQLDSENPQSKSLTRQLGSDWKISNQHSVSRPASSHTHTAQPARSTVDSDAMARARQCPLARFHHHHHKRIPGTRVCCHNKHAHASQKDRLPYVPPGTGRSCAHAHCGSIVTLKMILGRVKPDKVIAETEVLLDLGWRAQSHIVKLLDTFRAGSNFFVAMPHINHDKFRLGYRSMTATHVKEYMSTLLTSLQQLHAAGLVHHDLKPSNFLFRTPPKEGVQVDSVAGMQNKSRSPSTAKSGSGTSSTASRCAPASCSRKRTEEGQVSGIFLTQGEQWRGVERCPCCRGLTRSRAHPLTRTQTTSGHHTHTPSHTPVPSRKDARSAKSGKRRRRRKRVAVGQKRPRTRMRRAANHRMDRGAFHRRKRRKRTGVGECGDNTTVGMHSYAGASRGTGHVGVELHRGCNLGNGMDGSLSSVAVFHPLSLREGHHDCPEAHARHRTDPDSHTTSAAVDAHAHAHDTNSVRNHLPGVPVPPHTWNTYQPAPNAPKSWFPYPFYCPNGVLVDFGLRHQMRAGWMMALHRQGELDTSQLTHLLKSPRYVELTARMGLKQTRTLPCSSQQPPALHVMTGNSADRRVTLHGFLSKAGAVPRSPQREFAVRAAPPDPDRVDQWDLCLERDRTVTQTQNGDINAEAEPARGELWVRVCPCVLHAPTPCPRCQKWRHYIQEQISTHGESVRGRYASFVRRRTYRVLSGWMDQLSREFLSFLPQNHYFHSRYRYTYVREMASMLERRPTHLPDPFSQSARIDPMRPIWHKQHVPLNSSSRRAARRQQLSNGWPALHTSGVGGVERASEASLAWTFDKGNHSGRAMPNVAKAGTPGYRPPEVLLCMPRKYEGPSVDLWAAGCILGAIVTQRHPFFSPATDQVCIQEILRLCGPLRYAERLCGVEIPREKTAAYLARMYVQMATGAHASRARAGHDSSCCSADAGSRATEGKGSRRKRRRTAGIKSGADKSVDAAPASSDWAGDKPIDKLGAPQLPRAVTKYFTTDPLGHNARFVAAMVGDPIVRLPISQRTSRSYRESFVRHGGSKSSRTNDKPHTRLTVLPQLPPGYLDLCTTDFQKEGGMRMVGEAMGGDVLYYGVPGKTSQDHANDATVVVEEAGEQRKSHSLASPELHVRHTTPRITLTGPMAVTSGPIRPSSMSVHRDAKVRWEALFDERGVFRMSRTSVYARPVSTPWNYGGNYALMGRASQLGSFRAVLSDMKYVMGGVTPSRSYAGGARRGQGVWYRRWRQRCLGGRDINSSYGDKPTGQPDVCDQGASKANDKQNNKDISLGGQRGGAGGDGGADTSILTAVGFPPALYFLLGCLLRGHPLHRITASQALLSPVFTSYSGVAALCGLRGANGVIGVARNSESGASQHSVELARSQAL